MIRMPRASSAGGSRTAADGVPAMRARRSTAGWEKPQPAGGVTLQGVTLDEIVETPEGSRGTGVTQTWHSSAPVVLVQPAGGQTGSPSAGDRGAVLGRRRCPSRNVRNIQLIRPNRCRASRSPPLLGCDEGAERLPRLGGLRIYPVMARILRVPGMSRQGQQSAPALPLDTRHTQPVANGY